MLGFNLNSNDTSAEIAKGFYPGVWKPDYFAYDTVSIGPGAQQVFDVRAVVADSACTFTIQANILDGDRQVYQTISDDGQPFRVTSSAGSTQGGTETYSDYQVMYTGGVASPYKDGRFVRVNPKTYKP